MGTRTRAFALALALALPMTACTDDSDEERAAAALKAEMVANSGMKTGRRVDDQQTSCVADGMVSQIGVDRLQDYDLLTDDLRADESLQGVELTPEDADALAEVFAGCMDVERLMEREILRDLDLPRRQQRRATRCVRQGVTAQQVTRTLSLEFQGAENPVFQRLRDDLQACLR